MVAATVVAIEELPAVLTMRQVQDILGVSKEKTYSLARLPGFPAVRLGRSLRVPREAFVRWLAQESGRVDLDEASTE